MQEGGRAGKGKVIVEGFIDFDYEITLLTVRHVGGTTFCDPIGHRQVYRLTGTKWKKDNSSAFLSRAYQEVDFVLWQNFLAAVCMFHRYCDVATMHARRLFWSAQYHISLDTLRRRMATTERVGSLSPCRALRSPVAARLPKLSPMPWVAVGCLASSFLSKGTWYDACRNFNNSLSLVVNRSVKGLSARDVYLQMRHVVRRLKSF